MVKDELAVDGDALDVNEHVDVELALEGRVSGASAERREALAQSSSSDIGKTAAVESGRTGSLCLMPGFL